MPQYTKKPIKENGIYSNVYEETLKGPSKDKKAKQRALIDERVFDIHDSIADNAKWAAILTTAISIMYQAMDADTKGRMDPRQKGLMDVLVASYSTVQTRFEVQYEKEGLELIFKMIQRQKEIADIIKELEG